MSDKNSWYKAMYNIMLYSIDNTIINFTTAGLYTNNMMFVNPASAIDVSLLV